MSSVTLEGQAIAKLNSLFWESREAGTLSNSNVPTDCVRTDYQLNRVYNAENHHTGWRPYDDTVRSEVDIHAMGPSERHSFRLTFGYAFFVDGCIVRLSANCIIYRYMGSKSSWCVN
jgi:hypothetical protein